VQSQNFPSLDAYAQWGKLTPTPEFDGQTVGTSHLVPVYIWKRRA